MRERKPFERSWRRRVAARAEFKMFQERAEATIMAAANRMPNHLVLRNHFSFYVDIDNPDTVQAWFGQRSMFRRDLDGKPAFEIGVHLLYSLGPTGDVVVALFPCRSTLAHVAEEQVYIGIGHLTAHQLLKRVRSDLRSLVAYGYVTSLDAEATWGETLRVGWLRRSKPSQVDGKFVAGGKTLVGASLRAAFRAALSGAFGAFMRPAAVLAVAGILVWYGHRDWVALITGR